MIVGGYDIEKGNNFPAHRSKEPTAFAGERELFKNFLGAYASHKVNLGFLAVPLRRALRRLSDEQEISFEAAAGASDLRMASVRRKCTRSL